jgi:CBS domain-containing protein
MLYQLGAPLGVFLAGRRPVVTVPPTASLLEVCKAMVESSVHHLFVVDPVGVPLRCISCTDVLAALRR